MSNPANQIKKAVIMWDMKLYRRHWGVLNLIFIGVTVSLLGANYVHAAKDKDSGMAEDNIHVRTWNDFAKNILKLHHLRIKDKDIKKTSKSGGYATHPDYYIEEVHINQKNGKLLTKIQWEKANPDVMHTIELFIHDDKDRVIRDFQAAYLPGYHNAPVQTLITLHAYNGDLHAFRVWDASSFTIVERCIGKFEGKDVEFILDDDELYNLADDETSIMNSKEYKACFKGIPEKPGKYLMPQ